MSTKESNKIDQSIVPHLTTDSGARYALSTHRSIKDDQSSVLQQAAANVAAVSTQTDEQSLVPQQTAAEDGALLSIEAHQQSSVPCTTTATTEAAITDDQRVCSNSIELAK